MSVTFNVGDAVSYKAGKRGNAPNGFGTIFMIQCVQPEGVYLMTNGVGQKCPHGIHNWVALTTDIEHPTLADIATTRASSASTLTSLGGSSILGGMSAYGSGIGGVHLFPPSSPLSIHDQFAKITADYYLARFETTKPKNTMEITRDKVSLFFKSEPAKTFIKAGIMHSDETLTSEGKAMFMEWLFNQNADAFKTAVVDPILAEKKAEKA